jgi:hypothetical protein
MNPEKTAPPASQYPGSRFSIKGWKRNDKPENRKSEFQKNTHPVTFVIEDYLPNSKYVIFQKIKD